MVKNEIEDKKLDDVVSDKEVTSTKPIETKSNTNETPSKETKVAETKSEEVKASPKPVVAKEETKSEATKEITREEVKTGTAKATTGLQPVPITQPQRPTGRPGQRPGGGRPGGGRPGQRNNRGRNQRPQEFEERVVNISRVTTVVKGGRRFSFSALVVIGDKKGRVGQGHGKAKEVPEAIKKAIKDAKRNLHRVPIVDGRTVPHITQSKFVASVVLLKPAAKGRGIIASGAVRSVVELAGYQDIVTKSLGSSNKINAVKATIKALTTLKTAKQISELKG